MESTNNSNINSEEITSIKSEQSLSVPSSIPPSSMQSEQPSTMPSEQPSSMPPSMQSSSLQSEQPPSMQLEQPSSTQSIQSEQPSTMPSEQPSSMPQSSMQPEQLSSMQSLPSSMQPEQPSSKQSMQSEQPSETLPEPLPQSESQLITENDNAEPIQEPIEEPIQEPISEPIQEPIEEPIAEPIEEPIAEPIEEDPTQITPEELLELEELEKSLRSKIINRPPSYQKKRRVSTQYIERVQKKTPLTDNEESISRILIDNNTKYHTLLYFQPQIESKSLSIGRVPEYETTEIIETTKTELIETKYKKTTTQSLTQFLESQRSIPKPKNKFTQLIVHTHLQLLNSINILQSIEPPIIHFNITPETLQYNEIDATPVLTDFRLAFTKTTLENPEENEELFPIYDNYAGYPFEVYLLSHMQDTDVSRLAEEYSQMTSIPIEPNYPTTKEELISNWKTWDVFAINQYIYTFMTENNELPKYKELILSYLTADPINRPTILTLQDNIKAIFT